MSKSKEGQSPEEAKRHIEVAQALGTPGGQVLLREMEERIGNDIASLLSPDVPDELATRIRHRIMGLLQIVDEWGDSLTVGRVVAREAIQSRLVRTLE